MKKEIGKCNHCNKKFNYYLIHNGFNETNYAYCNRCGMTAFLHEYYSAIPEQCKAFFKKKDRYEKISKEFESFLEHCECGGEFTKASKPRCPTCNSYLSAKYATKYIEANAEGTKKGWHWQKSWNGLYAIVIENNKVENNWKKKENNGDE